MKITKVLVCGGRDYRNQEHVNDVLDKMLAYYGQMMIIHGNAGGADGCASRWAGERGVWQARVPALWYKQGRPAGILRNIAMLALQPDVCIAFPGGRGTAHMFESAQKAGIPTYGV